MMEWTVLTIDVNVFLRTLAAHHADHLTCRTLLDRLHMPATPILVPRLLLTELAADVRRTTGDALTDTGEPMP